LQYDIAFLSQCCIVILIPVFKLPIEEEDTMKLSNRTVLITGGTSGIGLGLGRSFFKIKKQVIVCGAIKRIIENTGKIP